MQILHIPTEEEPDSRLRQILLEHLPTSHCALLPLAIGHTTPSSTFLSMPANTAMPTRLLDRMVFSRLSWKVAVISGIQLTSET